MFDFFVSAGASFILVTVLMATFIFVPKGNLTVRCVKWSVNYTNFHKVAYWGLPLFLLIFMNVLAGLLLLIAAIVGLTFKKRYNAAVLAVMTDTATPPPIPAA